MPVAPTASPATALDALARGGVVLAPVDTVPGLAVRADSPATLDSLYRMKDRPADKLLSLAFADLAQLLHWLDPAPDTARRLGLLLPGPLTIVLEGVPRLGRCWPAWGQSVGVRLPGPSPSSPWLDVLPWPVALTSANVSGSPTPRSMAAVDPRLASAVDLVWPGECPLGLESTVLDLRVWPFRLLREGALSAGEIARRLGEAA